VLWSVEFEAGSFELELLSSAAHPTSEDVETSANANARLVTRFMVRLLAPTVEEGPPYVPARRWANA
jgi:hypothetical protein